MGVKEEMNYKSWALGIIVHARLYFILIISFYMKALELSFMTQIAKLWILVINLILLLNGHDCFIRAHTVPP